MQKNPTFLQVPRLGGGDEDILQYVHLRWKLMSKLSETDQNL